MEGGAAQGNPADMPPALQFRDDNAWTIGQPDFVVTSVKHSIPAEGSDWWGNDQIDTGLTEDRWLRAVEAKPGIGNKQVTHHLVGTLIQDADEDTNLLGRDWRGGRRAVPRRVRSSARTATSSPKGPRAS